jgi:hypothetical protein
VNLKDLLYSDRIKEMEDDVVPFGIMPDTTEQDTSMAAYAALIAAQKEWGL